jgi:hypothetical protein
LEVSPPLELVGVPDEPEFDPDPEVPDEEVPDFVVLPPGVELDDPPVFVFGGAGGGGGGGV